jgi:hypothetical protein
MKKLLVLANNSLLSSSLIRGALVPSLALGLGFAFWTATTPVLKAQTTDSVELQKNDKTGKSGKPGKGGGKCDVCHNPHNYHTISIPCDQVDKFLGNHPGDFRGRCEVTGVTNP